jgi:signal transduction histidine kinase
MTRLRFYPVYLLTALVILPMIAMTVAGLHLLKNERNRLEQQADNAQLRWLEQTASNLEGSVWSLRNELIDRLNQLSPERLDESLMELHRGHPLVRNVFRISEKGKISFPETGMHVDPETEEFLQRYQTLFSGRMQWFPPADEFGRSLWMSKGSQRRVEWRSWQWADRESLLLYLPPFEGSKEIVGVEIEMAALYARINVWLREINARGEELVLLDRSDRVLVATGDPEDRPVKLTTEMGALLPFARLGLVSESAVPDGLPKAFMWVAGSLGIFLLLCIVAGTLGLTAWVHRSRREAMQKTTFVSNVSHEFKTPLTTLRLYSEMLLEGRITDPDKQKSYLRTLRDESERLARLVHNALDFSRLEMGRNRLNPVEFDLTERIHLVYERLRERFEAVEMEVSLPEEPCRLVTDPDAAEQILLNLMDNAIKYAADGKRLDIQMDQLNGKVEVRIQDQGIGIPARERRKIFEAFHQADARLTRERGGTGLGLHIARRLARQLRGDLEFRQVPDGACFVWTLPGEAP